MMCPDSADPSLTLCALQIYLLTYCELNSLARFYHFTQNSPSLSCWYNDKVDSHILTSYVIHNILWSFGTFNNVRIENWEVFTSPVDWGGV